MFLNKAQFSSDNVLIRICISQSGRLNSAISAQGKL